jgi:AcrR family transcriptional regulator
MYVKPEAGAAKGGADPPPPSPPPADAHPPSPPPPDRPRTKAAQREATTAALLNSARELFAQRGYAGVGTEEIVQNAGVTRGALYHHFADKTELFAAVFEVVEAELTRRIDDVVSNAGTADPVELMKLGAATWMRACTEPEVHRIVLVDAPAVLGYQRWREVGLRYGLGLVQSLLSYAMEVGAVRRQPTEPLAHVLIGALDEAALYVAQAADQQAALAEVTAVLDDLMTALAHSSNG